MAKPYSDDLRERVVMALGKGESRRAIAARLRIAPSTVVNWAKRLSETGSVAPARFGGSSLNAGAMSICWLSLDIG